VKRMTGITMHVQRLINLMMIRLRNNFVIFLLISCRTKHNSLLFNFGSLTDEELI